MKEPLKLIQITDTHLFADTKGQLCGIPTEASLQAVLAHIKNSSFKPDLIALTGDISQDESEESYRRLQVSLQSLNAPICCLPGNHDDASLINSILTKGDIRSDRQVQKGGWQLLFLNTQIRPKTSGHLSDQELQFLEKQLTQHPEIPTVVFLHHPPLPTGSVWMDAMMLDNAQQFMNILDRFEKVKAVINGHIHQEFSAKRGRVKYFGTPSTCVQFLPGSVHFAIDSAQPGYRWLKLFPDGHFETGILRLKEGSFNADRSQKGY